jgi:signal transduction histidine kinase
MQGTASEHSERSSRVPWLVVLVILLVFAAAILLLTWYLRSGLITKIIQQHGLALRTALVLSPTLDLPDDLANDPEMIFEVASNKVLEAAKRKEVIAVRVFDLTGALQFGIGGGDVNLSEKQLAQVRERAAISWLEPDAKLSEVVQHETDTRAPLIRAVVPLEHEGVLIGAAEFILDGREVITDLWKLNLNLWLYGSLIFLFGGGVSAAAVLWAFRRLETANKLLGERTRSLLRANHELTLSAKTSAIGAITAHLIHDLKNPLFGLQSFVSARGSTEEEDWNIAQNTTERMQKVIGEIVRILQEEKTTEKYELSIEEVLSLLRGKLEPQCAKAGITFKTECKASGTVLNRDANIIILVVTNIVQNAIQATPRDGSISVTAVTDSAGMLFTIRDTGPGLPDHIRSTLFTPTRSTKANGSGLGLAISKQLANHIGAELLLKETSRAGTVFELRIPERVIVGELV